MKTCSAAKNSTAQSIATPASGETNTPGRTSTLRLSGVVSVTKLRPKPMPIRFCTTIAIPNDAMKRVKNEPSWRRIGAYTMRSSSTPKSIAAAVATSRAGTQWMRAIATMP